jgi:hypothetical protein
MTLGNIYDTAYAKRADPECQMCGGVGLIPDDTLVPIGSTWATLKEFEICDCVEDEEDD